MKGVCVVRFRAHGVQEGGGRPRRGSNWRSRPETLRGDKTFAPPAPPEGNEDKKVPETEMRTIPDP